MLCNPPTGVWGVEAFDPASRSSLVNVTGYSSYDPHDHEGLSSCVDDNG